MEKSLSFAGPKFSISSAFSKSLNILMFFIDQENFSTKIFSLVKKCRFFFVIPTVLVLDLFS